MFVKENPDRIFFFSHSVNLISCQYVKPNLSLFSNFDSYQVWKSYFVSTPLKNFRRENVSRNKDLGRNKRKAVVCLPLSECLHRVPEEHSEPRRASKMELLAKIMNGWKPFNRDRSNFCVMESLWKQIWCKSCSRKIVGHSESTDLFVWGNNGITTKKFQGYLITQFLNIFN